MDREVDLREFVAARGRALSRAAYLRVVIGHRGRADHGVGLPTECRVAADQVEVATMRTPRPNVPGTLGLLAAVLLAGCGGGGSDRLVAPETSTSITSVTPGEAVTSPSRTGVVPLEDGYVEPGRYRFVVRVDCDGVKHDPIACPNGVPDPPPIPLAVTVPEGWTASTEFHLLEPTAAGVESPAGAGLVMGWTSNTVGLNSDPCSSVSHELPDVKVGPGVDDFVDAVVSQKWPHVTAPVDTRVGGASGRYFTLTGPGPADLSECEEWRPWDPGFYAQGPNNKWAVWVLDVGGRRVLIVAQHFPGTSAKTVAPLRQMVDSIRFTSQ